MRELDDSPLHEILDCVKQARELATDHYSVWHAWAVTNYDQLKKTDIQADASAAPSAEEQEATNAAAAALASSSEPLGPTGYRPGSPPLENSRMRDSPLKTTKKLISSVKLNLTGASASLANLTIARSDLSQQQADQITQYVVEAIKGFIRSIILGQGQPVANVLQDTLRLLTLWFTYGTKEGQRKDVYDIMEAEIDQVAPEIWLDVVPQIIARMHLTCPEISKLLQKLLTRVASIHPQALVCPISVALNTTNEHKRAMASHLIAEMKKKKSKLVDEATMVSRELMRVAISPHEMWIDGLEKASHEFMGK